MVSNALERSKKIPTVVSLWSIADEILLSKGINACDVEWFYEIQTDEDKIFRLFRQIRLGDYTWPFQRILRNLAAEKLVYNLQKTRILCFVYENYFTYV